MFSLLGNLGSGICFHVGPLTETPEDEDPIKAKGKLYPQLTDQGKMTFPQGLAVDNLVVKLTKNWKF